MAYRAFFTILAATGAVSVSYAASPTVTTLSIPGVIPSDFATASVGLSVVGTGTNNHVTYALTRLPSTSSASASASASASTTSSGLFDAALAQETLILSPTDAVIQVNLAGAPFLSQSCKWTAGTSATATCVNSIAGQTGAASTTTEAVMAVAVTVFPQANGAAATVTHWSMAAGAAVVAIQYLL